MNWLFKQVEDILIRLKMKKYEKDKYFRVADGHDGLLPIEVLEGAYKGTIFTITDIKIIDENGKTRFDHKIIKKIPGTHISYYGEQFSNMVGDILLICIADAESNYNEVRTEVLRDEAIGNDYSEEFTESRTVSKKGSSVPKD